MSYSIKNRDDVGGGVTISSINNSVLNATGITLPYLCPVSISNAGNSQKANPNSEFLSFSFVGLVSDLAGTPNASNGQVTVFGRIKNITTSFGLGDPVYLGKTPGTLTNIKPAEGVNGFVAGDFIVLVGVIMKNESNSSQKDIFVFKTMAGQI
jgi:hypothetical protein